MSLGAVLETIGVWQQAFHARIAESMTQMHAAESLAAFGTLVFVGFAYGVLHAAGPGHGKLVVGSYMLADDHTIRRALFITLLSSLLQSLVAIVVVLVLFYGFGLARSQTELAAQWLEAGSFALIGLVGCVLVYRGIRGLPLRGHATHDCGGCAHHHDHAGHMPDAKAVAKATDAQTMAAMIVSIGIRPCSGGLILMFFACILGEVWAGIAGTLAMGAGTALTTGAIALAAAGSRKGFLKFFETSERKVAIFSSLMKIIGGLVVTILGGLFFLAALPQQAGSSAIAPSNHPLMRHQD